MNLADKSESLRTRRFAWAAPLLAAAVVLLGAILPAAPAAQLERKGQITEKLAVGRVVFGVTDHAIVVAATGDPTTPERPLPLIVPIGSRYLGVLLGAVEWDTPNAAVKSSRLELDLPRVAATAARRSLDPRPDELNDIEKIGVATLELLSPLAERIHDRVDLPPDQPLFQLLLADYAGDYGPEVWSMQYKVRQQTLGNDYWDTHLMRPAYYQLFPPEKGQPRNLVEVQYPKRAGLSLLDGVVRGEPALQAIAASSPQMGLAVAAIRENRLQKSMPGPLVNFFHAAMPVWAAGNSGLDAEKIPMVMAIVDDRLGFQWQIQPRGALPPPSMQPNTQDTGGPPSLRGYQPTP